MSSRDLTSRIRPCFSESMRLEHFLKIRSRDHQLKVFGYFHQKWSNGDYGDFDPRTNPRCILPQAAAKLNDPGDFMRYLMVENCAFKVDGWLSFY